MKNKVFFVDICNTLADVNGELNRLGFQTSVYPSVVPAEVFTEEMYRQAAPIWPIIRLVQRLAKQYAIVYLTARPENVREVTKEWLQAYGLPAGPVVHTQGRLKGNVALELVHPNWIAGAMEDSPHELESYARFIPGIRLLIPDWPHNEESVGIRLLKRSGGLLRFA